MITAEGDAGACGNNGKFKAANKDGTCPKLLELSAMEPDSLGWNINTAYDGPLPKCSSADPRADGGYRFRFQIDKVVKEEVGRKAFTLWSGRNLDAPTLCGTNVEFSSATGERPVVDVGKTVVLAQRNIFRDFEDAAAAWAIFSESGKLLYGSLEGEQLSLYMKDFGNFFPGLNIAGLARTVCRSVDVEQTLGAIKLSTSNGPSCELDSHSRGCCELWGSQYEIHGHGIIAPGKRNASINIGFAIRAPEFFMATN